jgi:predicted nucleic acid-binding protein
MKSSLYLETTVPSYLAGAIANDLTTAAHIEATKRWWADEREKYRLFVSAVVLNEIVRGNPDIAEERRQLVFRLPRLQVTAAVVQLAGRLFEHLKLPGSARTDAFHLALACTYEMDFLLTWNMKHIAGGHIRRALEKLQRTSGIVIPTICTPEELLEGGDENV